MLGLAEWVASIVWFAKYGPGLNNAYTVLLGSSFTFVFVVFVAALAGGYSRMVSVSVDGWSSPTNHGLLYVHSILWL